VYTLLDYGVPENGEIATDYYGPAMFIQKAVLKEFGFPKITTIDQYFDLIAKYKAKYGANLTGEAVDAYVAMYVIADALERSASLEPDKIRDALAATNLSTGPAAIVAYDSITFDTSGQNKNAALAIVQINDLGQGLERITVWPKASRRAGYTPVFPMPQK
jgi:ABC-type branched-subunit amino acid transport system substrate-binding protein